MTQLHRAVSTFLAIMCLGASASAETIQITSGSLVWTGLGDPAPVTLAGAGFSFEGSFRNGLFTPDSLIPVPDPTTTTSQPLMARAEGTDLPGTATLHGETFTNVGSELANSSLFATWTGLLEVPAGYSGGVLTAPFSFTGTFSVFTPGTATQTNLFGLGTASVALAPDLFLPNHFAVTSVRYDFRSPGEPVPEPMSMLLVGTGLAGLGAMRKRRGRNSKAGAESGGDLEGDGNAVI